MQMNTATRTGEPNSVAREIRQHAARAPHRMAMVQDDTALTYQELDELLDRVAVALQRDGCAPTDVIAICGVNSLQYAVVYLGAIRAGLTVAPLPPSATAAALGGMLRDCGACCVFLDGPSAAKLQDEPVLHSLQRVALDTRIDGTGFTSWLGPRGVQPTEPALQADWAFNIIYSSGTTGTPKGIVQPYSMRSVQLLGGSTIVAAYDGDSITLLSTPLYSNTTLVSFFATLGKAGAIVLMEKFDAARFLETAQRHRVTHAMLVPAQYQRLVNCPERDDYDIATMRTWLSTSAPFRAELKRQVLERWPARMVESYGMTEGGGTCVLEAHAWPDKLHTVGKPLPEHHILLIDDHGQPVAAGEPGEIVGHSRSMMSGYLNQSAKTAEAEWHDDEGRRYIRTGDIGRFDDDGFLVLLDRKKDMIISGGFNIYPSDLEAELRPHPAVLDATVVGVASERWGETPVAFVVAAPGAPAADELRDWVNSRLGSMQRLADLVFIERLPRSAIGKVLKRDLRVAYERKTPNMATPAGANSPAP